MYVLDLMRRCTFVKEKGSERKPVQVHGEDIVTISNDFYKLECVVTFVVDVMLVNGVPFLVTMSRRIRLRTAEHVPNRTSHL